MKMFSQLTPLTCYGKKAKTARWEEHLAHARDIVENVTIFLLESLRKEIVYKI
jgi:hypothetical protein